ncbi:MAG: alkaline phosphatase family protein [Gemmatimonadaceae bacterium]
MPSIQTVIHAATQTATKTAIPTVITLVADGARPDKLAAALASGALPALARIRDEGALHTITSVFPSVTGPAYAPFLTGCHPGSVGLPGLRWYDRARAASGWPGHARSYVGAEMRHVNRDLAPETRTMFELAHSSLGALNMIGRGLPRRQSIGQSLAYIARTSITHFRGNVSGWLDIDRRVADDVVQRVRAERPRYVFAAFTGIDKASHASGHDAPAIVDAMRIVDDVAARIREDAERAGTWDSTHLWVVSDHGHSPVAQHEDLAGVVRASGYRVLAHPWIFTRNPDVAVMVSGNAMAHVYVNLSQRQRRFWPSLTARWNDLANTLLSRESVDVLLLPLSPRSCEIRSSTRGNAVVEWTDCTYTYRPTTGDPLGVGEHDALSADESYDRLIESDYPDALVQIARLAACDRSGDIIISAARNWDLRAKYEPIPHMSSHGALHREHMLVPLLTNRPVGGNPRRTVDIMPSACAALGIAVPRGVQGRSFL